MSRCFLIAGCLVLMVCSQSVAGDDVNGAVASVSNTGQAMVGAQKDELRTWLGSIKPAAGDYRPEGKTVNYWETRVVRKRRTSHNE